MNVRHPDPLLLSRLLIVLIAVSWRVSFAAYGTPSVPEKYRRFIVHNADRRSLPETVLNAVGLSTSDVGRSFALVAGVDTYHKLRGAERSLAPAAVDLDRLVPYLRNRQYYDEIVVLRNEAVNDENFKYFLQVYFPERLRTFPRSRFLFAYSGHGIQDGSRGYLLQANAESLEDKANSISLQVIRTLYQEIVDSAYQSLALVNSCHSGAFLQRSFGGARGLLVAEPGAHAITAAGSQEQAWHVERVGPGSLFFEKFFAGLNGRADTLPVYADGTAGDGVVTVPELWAYLSAEIELERGQRQNPRESDIARDGSRGGLCFLSSAGNSMRRSATAAGRERTFSPSAAWMPLKAKGVGTRGFDEAKLVAGCNDSSPRDCISLGLEYEYWSDADLAARLFGRACDGGESRGCLWAGERLLDKSDDALNLPGKLRELCEAGEIAKCVDLVAFDNIIRYDLPDILIDKARAIDLFRRGCELGEVEACLKLGIATTLGEGGVKADREKAASLFRTACEQGEPGGCVHLANLQMADRAPLSTIMTLYRKACDQEDPEGCFRLAVFYWHGDAGLPSDRTKAQALLDSACDQGSGSACWWVVQRQIQGPRVVEPTKAMMLLESACEEGYEKACLTLGSWYETGDVGPVQDLSRAVYFYRTGCEWSDRTFSLSCAQAREAQKRFEALHRK